MTKEFVAASTVPLALSVLAEGESYGYAMIQRVRELSGGGIEWSEGMLYPVLHRMEEQGLIECEWRQGVYTNDPVVTVGTNTGRIACGCGLVPSVAGKVSRDQCAVATEFGSTSSHDRMR